MRKLNLPPISPEIFRNNMRQQIFWITECIAQGPYPDEKKISLLLQNGITHVFNVSTSPNISSDCGFVEVAGHHMQDGQRLSDKLVLAALNTMHRMLQQPESKLYIHCSIGWNRSPTILWLYFLACGIEPDKAKTLISRATLDAVPGHPKLVDERLMRKVTKHGMKHFLPLRRSEIVEPI